MIRRLITVTSMPSRMEGGNLLFSTPDCSRRDSTWNIYRATDKLKLDYSYGDWNGSSIDGTKNNGNIVQQVITVPTVGTSPGFVATQKYYYDSLNRIDDAIETIGNRLW